MLIIEFSSELWVYHGKGAWHFVTVPEEQSLDIKHISDLVKTGWGSIRVEATIGQTTFKTSVFPDNKGYVLPVKAAVRKAEGLKEGDEVTVRLEIQV